MLKKNKMAKKQLKKPQIKTIECLDFCEVKDYIYKLTKKDIDNWKKRTKEYCNFWHWIIDSHPTISNGCIFHLCELDDVQRQEVPDWVVEIHDLIFKEFAEHKKNNTLGDPMLTFHVWW